MDKQLTPSGISRCENAAKAVNVVETTTATQPTMTSLQIAEIAEKRHRDLMRSIRKMEQAWEKVTERKFALSEYTDATGRVLPCYNLTKEECLYIATKFNDEARARLIMRWMVLERQAAAPEPEKPRKLISGFTPMTDRQLKLIEKLSNDGNPIGHAIAVAICNKSRLVSLSLAQLAIAHILDNRKKFKLIRNGYDELPDYEWEDYFDTVMYVLMDDEHNLLRIVMNL